MKKNLAYIGVIGVEAGLPMHSLPIKRLLIIIT